jgi:hypothetical protein
MLLHGVLKDRDCFTTNVVFCAVGCGVFAAVAKERSGFMDISRTSKVGAAVFWTRRFRHHSLLAFKGKVAGIRGGEKNIFDRGFDWSQGLTKGCDGALLFSWVYCLSGHGYRLVSAIMTWALRSMALWAVKEFPSSFGWLGGSPTLFKSRNRVSWFQYGGCLRNRRAVSVNLT